MEILFENPLILIILVGVISAIFKNKNKDEKQDDTKKRVETRKTVQKSSDPFSEMKDVFREVQRSFQEEIKPAPTVQENANQKINDAKFAYPEEPEKPEQVIKTPRGLQEQKLKQQSGLDVDESKLIDAVIWSEILGPPRAKKPYSQNRIGRKH